MRLNLLDQRLLPAKEEYVGCKSSEDVIFAIRDMIVRGAPAIGVTAAYGCVLALNEVMGQSGWQAKLQAALDRIAQARPTAVNLAWAVDKMRNLSSCGDVEVLRNIWLEAAELIHADDVDRCRQIGKNGSRLIKNGDAVLTHCNAGALATGGYGTALGVIRAAVEEGKQVSVIADETRPLLQGGRLTAWELLEEGIPVKIAPDGASGELFRNNMAQLVIVGADRVAANGDVANKIGTLNLAIAAKYFHVPFYVACPLSTIDANMACGNEIPIEERSAQEITKLSSMPLAPENAEAINYAFDVTPAELIAGIITEKGILQPPYGKAIASVLAG